MKQQIKRYKNDNLKRAKNASYKSALKTAIKKVDTAVANNDAAAAKAALPAAISAINAAASKGVYHKNNAARKVSRISKAVNTLA